MRDEVEGAEDQEEEYYYYSSYDQFHSLPDEVLHIILSKLSDPKSLLRSSLVSHRFASILSNSSSLSLQIPSPILPTNHLNLPSSNPNHHHLSTRLLRFLTIPFRFLHHFVSPPSDLNSDDALLFSLSKLLQRFHNVRSLRVEFPCSCHSNIKFGYSSSPHHHDSTSFKWKAKLGLKIDTFTILLPTSLCKINEETDREEEEEESEAPILDWLNRGHGKAFWPMYYAFSMHRLLLLLIVKHPRLRSVVITDSKKQGKLVLEGEELVALRNLLVLSPKILESVESIVVPQHVKLWYVPELKLPLSGYVMKKVTLMAFKGVFNNPVGGGGGDDDDDADLRAGGFEDDENGIFEEAVMEILSNYKDSLKLSL